jgi:hypothetical protein
MLLSCRENQPPSCIIISPQNGSGFDIGDSIRISVEADDPEGELEEVRLFLNSNGIVTLNSYPFDYDLYTGDLVSGTYRIKASATDSKGKEDTDEVSVSINTSHRNQ